MLLLLVACADKLAPPQKADETGEAAACLDPRPAYGGCAATVTVTDATTGATLALLQRAYDADGNLVSEGRDNGGDGSVESIVTTTYDGDGNALTVSVDANGDGTADSVVTNTWDTDGNVLTSTTDVDADGVAETFTTYTYTDGELATVDVDQDGDGAADLTCTASYAAAGDGEVATVTCTDTEGATVNHTVTTFDATGEPIARESDANGDGTVDLEEAWTRDPDTCLVTASASTSTRQQEEDTVTREEDTTLVYDADHRVASSTTHIVTTSSEGEMVQDVASSAAYTCE